MGQVVSVASTQGPAFAVQIGASVGAHEVFPAPLSQPVSGASVAATQAAAAAAQPMERLSAEQFKAAVYAKGWTLRALATRWGLSREAVVRLAGDATRRAYLDDAVRGLPQIGPRRALRAAWGTDAAIDTKVADLSQPAPGAASAVARSVPKPRAVPKVPGYRYHGYMVLGAVVAVSEDLGEVAEEGMYGIVLEVIRERSQERYRVIFETGEFEMFTPDQVDKYLATTGLERDGLSGYVWRGEQAARQAFDAGVFVFREAL